MRKDWEESKPGDRLSAMTGLSIAVLQFIGVLLSAAVLVLVTWLQLKEDATVPTATAPSAASTPSEIGSSSFPTQATASACTAMTADLRNHAEAVDEAVKQINRGTIGGSDVALSLKPGYPAAVRATDAAEQRLGRSMDAARSVDTQLPANEGDVSSYSDLRTIVSDISTFLDRMPGLVQMGPEATADDMGALLDRPAVLRAVADSLSAECK